MKALKVIPVGQESGPERFAQFGQESCPAGEYLHSERLWMLEKVSAALKTTPTTIPQTPHISKNPQKKKKSWGIPLIREAEGCQWELKARNSADQLCASNKIFIVFSYLTQFKWSQNPLMHLVVTQSSIALNVTEAVGALSYIFTAILQNGTVVAVSRTDTMV